MKFILCLILSSLGPLVVTATSATEGQLARPNIVFILADDK